MMTTDQFKGIALDAGCQSVLMLHGLGANSLELTRLAKDLNSQGLTVKVPDIQGYCFDSRCTTWTHWMEQVQSLLWEMRKQYETVSVVGVSMGATLALQLAQREALTSVVLLAPALAYDGWSIPWYQSLMHLAPWVPFGDRYEYKERDPFGIKNDETRAMIKRMMSLNSVSEIGGETISLDHLRQGRRLIDHTLDHLSEVSSPSLIIHAVDDESVHIRHAEAVHEAIQTSQKEMIYLSDSYHMITVDNERETVHQETSRFIKKIINHELNRQEFEMPGVISAELRRYLKKQMI
jgi:carboxylesterase